MKDLTQKQQQSNCIEQMTMREVLEICKKLEQKTNMKTSCKPKMMVRGLFADQWRTLKGFSGTFTDLETLQEDYQNNTSIGSEISKFKEIIEIQISMTSI